MEILFEGKVGITMAKGHENLIPMQARTAEEQRAITVAGGRASGEARRRYRTMRESLRLLLGLNVTDEAKAEALKALGLDPTYQNAIQLSMASKALDGDVEAARFVRDTSGEKPAQAVDMSVTDKPFESLDLKALSDEDLAKIADDGGTDVVDSDADKP